MWKSHCSSVSTYSLKHPRRRLELRARIAPYATWLLRILPTCRQKQTQWPCFARSYAREVGCTLRKCWWVYAARFLKTLHYFRPEYVIFFALFQTSKISRYCFSYPRIDKNLKNGSHLRKQLRRASNSRMLMGKKLFHLKTIPNSSLESCKTYSQDQNSQTFDTLYYRPKRLKNHFPS